MQITGEIRKTMRIIALEEHFRNAPIEEAVRKHLPPGQGDIFDKSLASFTSQIFQERDLGAGRLQRMDAMGIDMQVLSYSSPGTQILPASEAVPLARDANDQLASAIAAHPERFAGFATLPTPNPEAAAVELGRAVQKLGFKGVMVNGRTGDRFLSCWLCKSWAQIASCTRSIIRILREIRPGRFLKTHQ
jgi:predicted TIM-barrel fold metal-dependent hydrolase